MGCATIGIDIMYNASSVFITTSVPRNHEGLAGGCLDGLLYVGMSFFLGWTDVSTASRASLGVREIFKTALFLGIGLAGAAEIVLGLGWPFMAEDVSDLDALGDGKALNFVYHYLFPLLLAWKMKSSLEIIIVFTSELNMPS